MNRDSTPSPKSASWRSLLILPVDCNHQYVRWSNMSPGRNPTSLLRTVTFPVHQVLESASPPAWISGCLADISAWMKEHHLQLNLAKTELLVVPATPTLQHDFSIQLGTSIITPSTTVFQKSWCNLWWPAYLQRAHCKDCSILQVCATQHQKNQALYDRACCTTSCPGPCRF